MTNDFFKDSIQEVLSRQPYYHDKDVKVIIDRVPCGIWLWDEQTSKHVYFLPQEIIQCLGFDSNLTDYLDEMIVFETSWSFVNPLRLKTAYG